MYVYVCACAYVCFCLSVYVCVNVYVYFKDIKTEILLFVWIF